MSYTVLDSDRIIASLELLSTRVYERFPQSGFYQVSKQLLIFGRNAQEDLDWVARPIVLLRVITVIFVLLLVIAVGLTFRSLIVQVELDELLRMKNFIPLLEAGLMTLNSSVPDIP